MKTCTKCGGQYPATEEFFKRRSARGLEAQCKKCIAAAARILYKNNVVKIRQADKTKRDSRRLRILEVYSNGTMKCSCCGESEIKFLCIDHVDGKGRAHRKELANQGLHFYLWIEREKYPDGFQVLCHNCNMAKGFYGTCPHQLKAAA